MPTQLLESPEELLEQNRLAALLELEILDTPEEQEFNELVRLASEICQTPISLVSLVDKERQWFKASVGLTARETNRNVSFCAHAIQRPGLFVVEDATCDVRFQDNGLVTGAPNIRFYAGMPLQSPKGYALGTLCVIDTVPRRLSESQLKALEILGRQVTARMQLRAREKALQAALTEKVAIEKSLESSRILFQTFVEHNPNICYFKAEDGKYLSYNAKFAELFGIGLNDWIGKSDYDTQQAEAADQFRAQDELVLNRGIVSEVSHQIRAADGRLVWLKLIKFAIRLNEQRSILAGVAIDVTPEVKKEQALSEANVQLMQMAQTDPLTGVSNRRFFEERIASEFARTQNAGQPLTLIILDIDDFKKRNDTYGHAAGDDALRMLGGLLRESLRGGDLPARIGGEEFAILLAGMNEAGATLVARRIQDRLRTADCGPVPMTVSMGIASASPELESWEKLYSLADRAMYQAKASGKNRFVMA